jgi:hypothetical protein
MRFVKQRRSVDEMKPNNPVAEVKGIDVVALEEERRQVC